MAEENLKLVVFVLEHNKKVYEYGIPIQQVYEITRPQPTTNLPGMPAFVTGVMNLRSDVIPVVDIKERFRFGNTLTQDTTRIIVVHINGKKCGILVDDVLEIIPIPTEAMSEAPEIAGGVNANFIIGIGKVNGRLIIALDMDKILNQSEVQELQVVV
jgi:purine-binding chemotaxis protein CheW